MKKKRRNPKEVSAELKHEAWLVRMGVDDASLKKRLPHTKHGRRLGIFSIPDYSTGPRVTSDRVTGFGVARKKNVYTGTEIMGIMPTHKGNLVPIRKDNKQEIIDVTNMRKGG